MKSFWKRLRRIPNLEEQALEIKNELNQGKNSVNIQIETGLIRYDLDGKVHGEIKIPHKHRYRKNIVNGIVKSLSKAKNSPEEMNQQDVRTVRKFKENDKN